MPSHLDNWTAQSAKLDRAAKARVRQAKRTIPLERDIQRTILQALRLHRVQIIPTDAGGTGEVKGLLVNIPAWLAKALRLPQDLPFGLAAWLHVPKGFPDLLGRLEDGRWIAVEVKRPGHKPTPIQIRYLDLLRKKGAVAFWADSVDSALAQFLEALHG